MFTKKKHLENAQERITELETENRNYTDIITNALLDAATADVASDYVGGLEIAAGALSRAFAAAVVEGSGARAFTPWNMAQIGRSLVEGGESVWLRIGRELRRPVSYDIEGGLYRLQFPEGMLTESPERVLHVRWNVDVNTGRGISPLGMARNLKAMAARLENSMQQELGASVGYLLPIPADGGAANVEQFKKDLADLRGKIAIVESARGGWQQSPQGATRREFQLERMGPDIPESSVRLHEQARNGVLAACGYPVALLGEEDGTAQREAWRRYLHGSVSPLGRLVEQAAMQAGLDIRLEWDNLFASDISGRARAFASLVNAGMSLQEAAAASGILNPEG